MKQQVIDKLATALQEADKAARAVKVPDVGSINMDSPVIKLPRWRDSTIEKLVSESGIMIDGNMGGLWQGYRFVRTFVDGVASKRTIQAEVVKSVLEKHGFQACVWYQTD